jgi:hypothetical protein
MEEESENENGNEEEYFDRSSGSLKDKLYRYRIPALVVVTVVATALFMNAINSSISGNVVSGVRSEFQDLIVEKSRLESQNRNLEKSLADLQVEKDLLSGIVNQLNKEKIESLETPYGFEAVWDKYVISSPKQKFTWFINIINNGYSIRTFSLELKLKSIYNDVFYTNPSTGSLTLQPGNSGTLNVELVPENQGYAIFQIYVNGDYVGDLVVFSL